MADNGFIQEFQTKIGELSGLHQQLRQNIEQKNGFLRDVSGKLGGISERLNRLADRIAELKTELDNLRGQMGNNTNDIQASQAQIQRLTQENEDLNRKVAELTQQQQQMEQERNQCREQLQQLTAENQRLTVANQELQARIDILDRNPGQEAIDEQIRQAVENATRPQLELLEQNRQTMEQNRQRIEDLEQQIQQLTAERDDAIRRADQHGTDLNNNRDTVAGLQQQIQQLGQQNEQMRQVITDANRVIDEAKASIQAVLDNPEFNDSSGAINRLIEQIEAIITRIEGTVGANYSAQGPQLNRRVNGEVFPPLPPGPRVNRRVNGEVFPPLPEGPNPYIPNPITGPSPNISLSRQNASTNLLGPRPPQGPPPNSGISSLSGDNSSASYSPVEQGRQPVGALNKAVTDRSNVTIHGAGLPLKDLIAKLRTVRNKPVKLKPTEYYSDVINTLEGFIERKISYRIVKDYIDKLVREDDSIFKDYNRNGYKILGGKRKTRKLNRKTKRRKNRKTRKMRKRRSYKGGFVYGATTKRQSLASQLSSSASSSSNSSKNKSKKNKYVNGFYK